MSLPDRPAEEPVGFSPTSLLVLLVFAGAGPPLGGLGFVLCGSILSGGLPVNTTLAGHVTFLSYFFGGLQALFVAFVAATYQAMSVTGRIPYRPVLLAALLAAVIADVIMFRQLTEFLLVFTVLHVVSGLLCCLIFNLLMVSFRRKPNHQTVRP